MAADRLTTPTTSVGVGALLGGGTAVTIITLSHPVSMLGGVAAAATVLGGLLVAIGFAVTDTEFGAVRLASGGIAIYIGSVLVIGSLGITATGVAPISILASGGAICGAVLLSLVVVGYTDARALKGHGKRFRIWSVLLLAVGIAAVGLSVTTDVLTEGAGNLRSAYLTAISEFELFAPLIVLCHLALIVSVVGVTVEQFNGLGLLEDGSGKRLVGGLQRAVFAVAFVILIYPLAAFIGIFERVLATIARYSLDGAAALSALGSISHAPAIHRGLFVVEGLILAVFCLGLTLQTIRAVRVERAAIWIGYAVPPTVVIVSLAVGIGVIPDVVATVIASRFGEDVTSLSVGLRVGVAALAGTVFFIGAGLVMWMTRLVLCRIYRFRNCGLAAVASAGLFVGSAFLGFSGVWPPLVAGCLLASILTWDTLENGVRLGEQLDGRFNAVHNEVVHLFASGAVGVVALFVWLGTYEASRSLNAGEAPSALVVSLLLAAAVVFAFLLRRAGR